MNFAKIAVTALALALGATTAFAQLAPSAPTAPRAPTVATVPAPTTPAPAVAPTDVMPKVKGAGRKQASTPEGIACSAEADEQKLTGKPRTSFRRKCIAQKKAGGAKKI